MADRRAGCAIRLDDGTAWAAPDDPHEVQHTMRYGSDEQKLKVALTAAELIATYEAIFWLTAKRRSEVIRRMRAVMRAERKEP